MRSEPWTTQARKRRRSSTTGLAAVTLAGVMGASAGALEGPRESWETQDAEAIIVGPLLAEFAAPARYRDRAPAADLKAAGLARAALTARFEGPGRQEFAALNHSPLSTAETDLAEGRLTVTLFDGAQPGPIFEAFSPDRVEAQGFVIAGREAQDRGVALRYEADFDAAGGADGLDIGVTPRAGLAVSEETTATRAGAEVRIGRYLGAFGETRPAWWIFAGADRQALMVNPAGLVDLRDMVAIEPYAVVGDAQAGVALRFMGADFSLAYVRRETRYESATESWVTAEDFAALTWTVRR